MSVGDATQPQANQAPVVTGATTDASPALDAAAIAAERDHLKKELAKVLDEVHAKKAKAREAEMTAAKLAAEQGQYKEALDRLSPRLAELEALAPLAEKWRAFEENETKAIEAKKAALPEAVQRALDAAGGLEAKRAVLAAFESFSPSTPPPKAKVPPGGAAHSDGVPDYEAAWKNPAQWQEVSARDPEGAARFRAAKAKAVFGGQSASFVRAARKG